ncbi:MAG: holdfast attachment protein HfaA [Ponticaulis sp.]|nr:holdfast attachment protein HfaA [Ponticaulis sp.]
MKQSANTLRTGLFAVASCSIVMVPAAWSQAAEYSGQFEIPYGSGFGDYNRPYDAYTRDSAGNRVIVDGRIILGDDLSTLNMGMTTPWGSTQGSGMIGQSQAIGNQLNVITQGNYNTIIIDNNQINNGDQTAILNGELDLND